MSKTGGTLLDNSSVTTLLNPEKHSFHCLLDVPVCVGSQYHILSPPPAGETLYGTGWMVESNDMLITAGRALGSKADGCTTCGSEGTQKFGFRAAVTGTIKTLDPPVLTVTGVDALEGNAAGCLAAGTTAAPQATLTDAPSSAPMTGVALLSGVAAAFVSLML